MVRKTGTGDHRQFLYLIRIFYQMNATKNHENKLYLPTIEFPKPTTSQHLRKEKHLPPPFPFLCQELREGNLMPGRHQP